MSTSLETIMDLLRRRKSPNATDEERKAGERIADRALELAQDELGEGKLTAALRTAVDHPTAPDSTNAFTRALSAIRAEADPQIIDAVRSVSMTSRTVTLGDTNQTVSGGGVAIGPQNVGNSYGDFNAGNIQVGGDMAVNGGVINKTTRS